MYINLTTDQRASFIAGQLENAKRELLRWKRRELEAISHVLEAEQRIIDLEALMYQLPINERA